MEYRIGLAALYGAALISLAACGGGGGGGDNAAVCAPPAAPTTGLTLYDSLCGGTLDGNKRQRGRATRHDPEGGPHRARDGLAHGQCRDPGPLAAVLSAARHSIEFPRGKLGRVVRPDRAGRFGQRLAGVP